MTPSEPILARLQELHPHRTDLALGRIERLLARLGHPERRLAPVVHIAGTNGKGSTLAMLDAMLAAAGRRVQRYVSPHLVRFNERILLGGEAIDDARLAAALGDCERTNAGDPITFFEITTAAAFLVFASEPAEVLLLETGLGGRLDATNVVPRPLLTLISPVSLDHEAFLGRELQAIAGEKAGILKAGVPAVVGPQDPTALAVVERRAAALGAPLARAGAEWDAREAGGRLLVRDGTETLDLPPPALAGVHQFENAGLAVASARRLGDLAPTADAIAEGLRRTTWPARLQRLRRGPLVERLGPQHELWLDGGHNPAAGEVLARSLPGVAKGRPVHLVLGMLQTKDASSFLRPLGPYVASLSAVPVEGKPAGRDPAELAAMAQEVGLPAARVEPSVAAAVDRLASDLPGPALVLVCGSLYLAGGVLRRNG